MISGFDSVQFCRGFHWSEKKLNEEAIWISSFGYLKLGKRKNNKKWKSITCFKGFTKNEIYRHLIIYLIQGNHSPVKSIII